MRAALGVTLSNRVVVARGDVSSDLILADALVKAGCVRGVLLDRGAHVPVIFDRAGTSSLPKAHYEPTVLYGIAKPMAPRALRFIAEQAVAQAK